MQNRSSKNLNKLRMKTTNHGSEITIQTHKDQYELQQDLSQSVASRVRFGWINSIAGQHRKCARLFLATHWTFCDLFLLPITHLPVFFYQCFLWNLKPKLKASLISTDLIVATISSCQGIKMCSIHLL